MAPTVILTYSDVQKKLSGHRAHLLLGNGFSVACDPIFQYKKLYDNAVSAGLSQRAQKVFARIGTNNFEAVMCLLADGHWLAKTYRLITGRTSELLRDLRVIKRTLVEAVAHSHLEHTGRITTERKDAARAFLAAYYDVFCTNYDLLAYWVNMHAGKPLFEDGFRADPEDHASKALVFSEHIGRDKGMYFIHGALHLFVERGWIKKHSWVRSGERLTRLVRTGLTAGQYPLFVAEGTHRQKLEQISRNGYLSYAFGKLGRIEGPLVSFGFSFGESDRHISNAIAWNGKITQLYVGIHGDPTSPLNRKTVAAAEQIVRQRVELIARTKKKGVAPLELHLYNSETAGVWSPPASDH